MPVTIPQDIIYNIIEAVAGHDKRLLKECALVSSSFLLPCRKHLFSSLYLIRDQACRRLHQVLVENPVVQSFVRSITIRPYEPLNYTSLIAILRLPFCSLESFSIIGSNMRYQATLNWNNFSSELKDTLSTIIHSPTLKTLHLDEISVPTMLFHGINLTKLELTTFWPLSPNEFDGEQSRLLTQAASEGMPTTALHTVVDYCVWNYYRSMCCTRFPTSAYFSLIWGLEGPTEPIFLPFMCRLRVLKIYINPFSATMSDFDILSILIRSLRVSLTSPATLEHIKFNIVFTGGSNRFDHDGFYDDLHNADVWSHLDSIITHPTGSRLQRVDINIKYNFVYRDDDSEYIMEPLNTEVLEPVLDALPLLRKKGILFVEVTEELY
jgi:hypothetical protein